MEPGRQVSAEALQAVQAGVRTEDSAGHLLEIIECQPACLLRVDLEGQFLAVNQAGLSLLGAESLAGVLATNVTERISATNGGHWTEFAHRVWNGAPGSFECSLMREPGSVRTILFHAIALPDHPDQIPSLLLTARDLSDSRANDTMAEELAEVRTQLAEAKARLADAAAPLAEARTQLAEAKARLADATTPLAEARAQLNEARAALDEQRTLFERALEGEKVRGTELANELRSERAMRQQLESTLEETRHLQASLAESHERRTEDELEVKTLREDAQHLEPLAVIGRLALTVSEEVQTCLASAESSARRQLAQSTCGDAERADLEALRRDLSQAARLLRQVARLGAKP